MAGDLPLAQDDIERQVAGHNSLLIPCLIA